MPEEWSNELDTMAEKVNNVASEVIRDVLADRSEEVFKFLKQETPVGETGELVRALKKEKYKKGSKEGYRVFYDGYDSKGRPYQVIANSLNRGYITPTGGIVKGNHFIDKAVKKLKGMDEEINKRWTEEMNKEK